MSTAEYLRLVPINREGDLPPGLNLKVTGTVQTTNLITDTITVNTTLTAPINLDALSDVVISAPATDQVVKYNGTSWVNSAASTLPISLDNLSDVVISAPSTNQIVHYNGTNWVNVTPPVDVSTELAAGTWTPTYTAGTNMTANASITGTYMRVGKTVHCTIFALWNSNTSAAGANTFFINVPVVPNSGLTFLDVNHVSGSGVIYSSASFLPLVVNGTADATHPITVYFLGSVGGTSMSLYANFDYTLY